MSADYTSSFIGRARFFLEVNPQMPRTFGRNQIHVSQVEGWYENDRPLIDVAPPPVDATDHAIAAARWVFQSMAWASNPASGNVTHMAAMSCTALALRTSQGMTNFFW